MIRLVLLGLALAPVLAAAEEQSPCERLVMLLQRSENRTGAPSLPISLDQGRTFHQQNNVRACRDGLIRVEADRARSGREASGASVAAQTIPLSRIIRMKAFDKQGREIGEVGRVAVGRDGRLYALVGMGGFFGMGRRDVGVALDEAAIDGGRFVIRTLTEEEMRAQPSWRQGQGEEIIGDRTAEVRILR